MKSWKRCAGIPVILSAAVIVGAQDSSQAPQRSKAVQSHVAFAHELPVLDGKHLGASIVEVTYGPGGFSLPHSHPCPVIGYVVEGDLRIKLNRDPEVIYHAGQSFYEAPNSAHLISANASNQRPVKFLAYLVCDHQGPLSVALPNKQTSGERP